VGALIVEGPTDFSPEYFSLYVLFRPFLISAVSAFIMGAGTSLFFRENDTASRRFTRVTWLYFFVALPNTILGFTVGFLIGVSRSPAIGTVIPAVLTLIGGLGIYVFGTENRFKVIVGYSVVVLVGTLLYGVERGAFDRESTREHRLNVIFEEEARLRAQRKNLGLPLEVPTWSVPAEPK
jgi:hypothetical protein